jgi:hypothetical protein
MTGTLEEIRTISNRLARSLGILIALFIPAAFYSSTHPGNRIATAPMAAFVVGVIGGFVGLQRRLKKMCEDDLALLANSWVYVCLAPLVGGVLAVLVYVLFVSGLLAGDLFPKFVPDQGADKINGLPAVFAIHGDATAYAKMVFWCFVAGFSERFATDIISRFENRVNDEEPSTGGGSPDDVEPRKGT